MVYLASTVTVVSSDFYTEAPPRTKISPIRTKNSNAFTPTTISP